MFAENILRDRRCVFRPLGLFRPLGQRLPATNRRRTSELEAPLSQSRPRQLGQHRWILLCALLLLGDIVGWPANPWAGTALAQRVRSSNQSFEQRCQSPHGAVFEQVPLRQAIDSVAKPGTVTSLNVWLDRAVNPDQLVTPSSLGPTRFASLQAIASAAGCLSVAAGDCVIIGRPDWVASIVMEHNRTLASRASRERRRIDVRWPLLTTPEQAVAVVRRKAPWAKLSLRELPHDLWPAVDWHRVSPAMAWLLIEGQFLAAEDIAGKAKLPFRKSYVGPQAMAAAKRTTEASENLAVSVAGAAVTVSGDIEAQARFCALWLGTPPRPDQVNQTGTIGQSAQQSQAAGNKAMNGSASASNQANGSEPAADVVDPWKVLRADRRQFTLEVIDKPAGAVLLALLQNAGVAAEIDPEANKAAQTLVNLQDRDQTLEQLVQQVLRKASLTMTGGAGKARISLAD